MERTLTFVTVDALQTGDVLLGVEQHGFVLPDLRVRLAPERHEPLYVSPGILDQDRPVVLLPDTRLTTGGLIEAARLYLRLSGEHGDSQTAEVEVLVRQPTAAPGYPEFRDVLTLTGLQRGIFVHPRLGRVGFDVIEAVISAVLEPVQIPHLEEV